MNVSTRTNLDSTFYEHVKNALEASGQRHDAQHAHLVAKMLYTETLISVRRTHAWCTIENPHFMGRNMADIAATVKDMAP